ncbi:ras-related protein Rab-37 [Nephila pilipes]|uniref:Ras-related protein Rab-37 n=1 Tax=Nephila pilipes TaxID=299642 RepID=A0A8X6K237_NEPPI|nr:ras-related protein Rab-37 [Nephila pilipes]
MLLADGIFPLSSAVCDLFFKYEDPTLLLLYDVTNKTSFDNTRAWLGEINEYAQDDVVIMLIGNKADAGTDRVVMYEDGERLSKEYGVTFMETSAKTGTNVELAFMAVARELKYRQSCQADQESKFNVKEYVRQESTKSRSSGTCCG